MKEERKTKYTIAVISGRDTFFYNGYFFPSIPIDNFSFLDNEDVKGFFEFYDERDDCIYLIRWDKVIWIKEVK